MNKVMDHYLSSGDSDASKLMTLVKNWLELLQFEGIGHKAAREKT